MLIELIAPSLNTNTPSRIKDPKRLYIFIKENSDDVVAFKGDTKSVRKITPAMIAKGDVVIAIPKPQPLNSGNKSIKP